MQKNIEQLDGGDLASNDETDKYTKTALYWEKGKLGTIFQTYLDVIDVIENSDLTEVSKDLEKEKVLAARKEAFGNDFKQRRCLELCQRDKTVLKNVVTAFTANSSLVPLLPRRNLRTNVPGATGFVLQ